MWPMTRARSAAVALIFPAASFLFVSQPVAAHADPLAPIWTGAYVGVHGGGVWSDIDTTDFGGIDSSALTGGGHAGFNMGFGGIVAGVEADINYDGSDFGFSTAGGGSADLSTDWNASLRGRIGVPVGPALLYATAGIAWTGTTLTEKTASGFSLDSGQTFTGVVYGIGAETYVLPNLSLRLEALRYDYGSESFALSGAAAAAQEIDPSETVVRAGVSFHLN